MCSFPLCSKVLSSGLLFVGWDRWPSSTLDSASGRSSLVRAPIRDVTSYVGGSRAVEAGSRWRRRPSARLRRRRWHDGVRCGIVAALTPAWSVGDGSAGVVGVSDMEARDYAQWDLDRQDDE